MTKYIEHHQTIIQTHFRLVDDEHSYPPPQPIQQLVYLATEAEFLAALEQIKRHLVQLQSELVAE